jgi:hypothetical protein
VCAFGQHRGGQIFFSEPGSGCRLDRRRATEGVDAPGVRAVYDSIAEGGGQMMGLSYIEVDIIAVPP